MDVRVCLWRELSTKELMLLNYGVGEDSWESLGDCKEIQQVHSKGDQPWVFFGRNDAKAETPVLWPPHVKNWLIGKDSDAGRDWGQEEKGTTEDEMAGWHHWLNGYESAWTLGVCDGQGGRVCRDSWGRKESDMTERLKWSKLNLHIITLVENKVSAWFDGFWQTGTSCEHNYSDGTERLFHLPFCRQSPFYLWPLATAFLFLSLWLLVVEFCFVFFFTLRPLPAPPASPLTRPPPPTEAAKRLPQPGRGTRNPCCGVLCEESQTVSSLQCLTFHLTWWFWDPPCYCRKQRFAPFHC